MLGTPAALFSYIGTDPLLTPDRWLHVHTHRADPSIGGTSVEHTFLASWLLQRAPVCRCVQYISQADFGALHCFRVWH